MRALAKRLLAVGIALAIALSMAPGGVVAQDSSGGDVNLGSLVDVYNANVDDAPGIARGRLAGETIEVRVGSGNTLATKDTGTAYHVTTNEDGRIVDHGDGDADSPTIRIRTSEATMDRILESDEPAKAFDREYGAGNIKISGLTITKAVEVELAKFAAWLGKTFGLF